MLSINITRERNTTIVTLWEGRSRIAAGADRTAKLAAKWLVRHMYRKLDAMENMLIEMGLLTEEEITQIADGTT